MKFLFKQLFYMFNLPLIALAVGIGLATLTSGCQEKPKDPSFTERVF